MVQHIGLRLCLSTIGSSEYFVETLHSWSLGIHGSWLDMGFQRAFRLGLLPLRALGAVARSWLGMGARQRVGTGLGNVEGKPRPHRLGSASTGNSRMARTLVGFLGGDFVPHRQLVVLFRELFEFWKQHPALLPADHPEHGLFRQHHKCNSLPHEFGSSFCWWSGL